MYIVFARMFASENKNAPHRRGRAGSVAALSAVRTVIGMHDLFCRRRRMTCHILGFRISKQCFSHPRHPTYVVAPRNQPHHGILHISVRHTQIKTTPTYGGGCRVQQSTVARRDHETTNNQRRDPQARVRARKVFHRTPSDVCMRCPFTFPSVDRSARSASPFFRLLSSRGLFERVREEDGRRRCSS